MADADRTVRQLQFELGKNLNLCLAVAAADMGVIYFKVLRRMMTKGIFFSI